MIYYEALSKERLYELALDLKQAITNADVGYLKSLTPHMHSAVDNFVDYVNKKCPTCGKSRREL